MATQTATDGATGKLGARALARAGTLLAYIAGCTQETCPPGAGRNYTNHCTCPANTKEVYDPCRPGFLVSCDPA
jgi:hypothetical protein